MSCLTKLIHHKKILLIKSMLSEISVWVYRTYNGICVLDINEWSQRPGLHEIRTSSLSLIKGTEAEWAIRSATKSLSNQNNEKYIDKRSDDATTGQKFMNELLKLK